MKRVLAWARRIDARPQPVWRRPAWWTAVLGVAAWVGLTWLRGEAGEDTWPGQTAFFLSIGVLSYVFGAWEVPGTSPTARDRRHIVLVPVLAVAGGWMASR